MTTRPCPKCGKMMIRAALYDPDGEIPLNGMVMDEQGEPWACINQECENGKQNLLCSGAPAD